jgi:FkbH-like protein
MHIDHPLDAAKLLQKKKSIQRELREKKGLLERRIAILGGSTTAEVAEMLEICLLMRGIKPVFYQSAYNQYLSEALQPEKSLQDFMPELVYIHTSGVNISEYPSSDCTRDDVQLLLESQLENFTAVWDGVRRNLSCPVIQNNFDEPWCRPLGNLDGSDYRGKSRFVSRLNEAFADAAASRADLFINDIHYLSAKIGLDNWFSPRQWYLYKYAMDMQAIVQLASHLAAVIAGIFGLSHKCLVVDLDNTLWGGVIGDDGVDGIVVGGHTARAEAFRDMQRYVLALKQRGVLLSVCSKNDDKNARVGFTHPESILGLDDFSSFHANWDDKPDNIVALAKELNIGIDALVFLDDNPAERDIVRQQLPDVAVPDVGNDIDNFIRVIEGSALFEIPALLADDLQRAQQYNDNRERQLQVASYASYDEFLQSLNMRAVISPFRQKDIARIVQLINKTNQFNLTTRRCVANEIMQICESEEYIGLSGCLIDKYGDNGLVSVVAGKIKDSSLHIDLWLMSCRVLKRGLEAALLQVLCERARQRNILSLVGYYRPTEKNNMVADMYRNFGFSLQTQSALESVWVLDLHAVGAMAPVHFIGISAGDDV